MHRERSPVLTATNGRPPMSRSRTVRLLAGVGAALLGSAFVALAQAPPAQAADLNLTQYVNPLIGTDDSNSPNPVGGGAGGSTFPGATVPFGMTQFSPDTPTASPSGYRDRDRTIESFSLTHFNGAGCPTTRTSRCCPSPARSARHPAPAGPATPPRTPSRTRARPPATTATGSTDTASRRS